MVDAGMPRGRGRSPRERRRARSEAKRSDESEQYGGAGVGGRPPPRARSAQKQACAELSSFLAGGAGERGGGQRPLLDIARVHDDGPTFGARARASGRERS